MFSCFGRKVKTISSQTDDFRKTDGKSVQTDDNDMLAKTDVSVQTDVASFTWASIHVHRSE